MLLSIKHMSGTVGHADALRCMALNITTLFLGTSSTFFAKPAAQLLLMAAAHALLLPVLPWLWAMIREARLATRPDSIFFKFLQAFTIFTWCCFGATFDLSYLRRFPSQAAEEVTLLVLDFAVKIVFSNSLLLATFKHIDARRCAPPLPLSPNTAYDRPCCNRRAARLPTACHATPMRRKHRGIVGWADAALSALAMLPPPPQGRRDARDRGVGQAEADRRAGVRHQAPGRLRVQRLARAAHAAERHHWCGRAAAAAAAAARSHRSAARTASLCR
jgi:hypothetical protein